MDAAARRRFFAALQKQNPAPATELIYENTYQLLVAVVLSAQSTDVAVNKATRGFFSTIKTPAAMLALGEQKLTEHVRTIGLFRAKARHIIALSDILTKKFGGEVPRARADLESLPGVGRKTANVVLNTAFGEPTIAVDTHIFRVANRTGLAPGKTPAAVEQHLLQATPPKYRKNAHHWLILHGRYVCRARKPLCGACITRRFCEFPEKDGG